MKNKCNVILCNNETKIDFIGFPYVENNILSIQQAREWGEYRNFKEVFYNSEEHLLVAFMFNTQEELKILDLFLK